MLKKYCVSIPLAGAIHISVEAESKEAAIVAAWKAIDEKGEEAGEVEWEFISKISEGNVLRVPLNEIEVSRVGK
jgi:hypothetical protein